MYKILVTTTGSENNTGLSISVLVLEESNLDVARQMVAVINTQDRNLGHKYGDYYQNALPLNFIMPLPLDKEQ